MATSSNPERIGRYEIVRRIAHGGMGSVYQAKLRGAGEFARTFAVKVCHPHLVDEPGFRASFLQEARLAALIRHPNVVPVFEVGQDESLYMVLEYVAGCSVATLFDRVVTTQPNSGVPLPIALRLILDGLAGLGAAHNLRDEQGRHLGIVHRDVSPHNLLIGSDGRTFLTDFGIARANDSSVKTSSGFIKGKVGYMAPEQARGDAPSTTSDLFSMALVLWELLTGRKFRDGGTAEAQLLQCISEVYETVGPATDRSLRDSRVAIDYVLEQAMDRDPDRRYASADELSDALRETNAPIADYETVYAYLLSLGLPDAERARSGTVVYPPETAGGVTAPVRHPTALILTPSATPEVETGPPRQIRSTSKGRWLWGALTMLVLALVGLGSWFSGLPKESSFAQTREPRERTDRPAQGDGTARSLASPPPTASASATVERRTHPVVVPTSRASAYRPHTL